MHRHACANAVMLAGLLAAPAAAQTSAGAPAGPSRPAWAFGKGLDTGDGPVTLRLRTRLHMDLADPDLGDVGRALEQDFDRALNLRRARWLADVTFSERGPLAGMRLRAQVDFASSVIDWKDLYVRRDGTGCFGPFDRANFRVGHFREPMGLEAMTSVSHLPFIERSAATNAFTPGRARGVQWTGHTDHWLVQAGAFRGANGEPFPDDLQSNRALTVRAVHQNPDSLLAQVGGGLSLRDPGEIGIQFRSRPGTRLLGTTTSTGTLKADRFLVASAEALWLGERSTASAEWFAGLGNDVGPNRQDVVVSGGHVSWARFLTAGSHAWNKGRGGYRAANVADAWVSGEPGNGSVELAARLGWVELNDGIVRGGRSLDLECGINWYLQPATRFMLHGLLLSVDAPGRGHEFGSAVLARLQLQL